MTNAYYTEELIERFVLEDLNDQEKASLDEKIKENPELNNAIEFNRELIHSIQKAHLIQFRQLVQTVRREMLLSFKNNTIPIEKKFSVRPGYKIAAAILILLAAGWLTKTVFFISLSADELYETYYSPYPAEQIIRSISISEIKYNKDLITSYEKGEYGQIINVILPSLEIGENNNYLNLLIGISFMETGNYKIATEYFQKILDNPKNIYFRDAEWYIVFCYAMLNETDKAKDQLNEIKNSNSPYASKAKQLLRRF